MMTGSKNISCVFILLLSIIVFFIIGCGEERIEVDVDSYLEFLDITPEQEQEIRPLFIRIRDFVDDYNLKIVADSQAKKKKQERRDYRLNLKVNLLENLNPLIVNLSEILDEKQQETLWRSELYYYYTVTKSFVLNNYAPTDELTYDRVVVPGYEAAAETEFTLDDYVKYWTVNFGIPMHGLSGNIQKSIESGARNRFPTSIQATLMDKSLLDRESHFADAYPSDIDPDAVIEIRVILSSLLHANYVDINNWIPFLELSNGSVVEPIKNVERDKSWFDNRGEQLLSNRLPKILYASDQLEEQVKRRGRVMRRGRLESLFGYYQLFFPARVNGVSIFSREISHIRLVFLEEVGSNNRAKGIWRFDW